jgi:hypothetical protein
MDKIQRQIVFILGAGASAPYGFPTGRGLRESMLRNVPLPANTTLNAADFRELQAQLEDSPVDSVDAFLETRRDLESIGKRAIAEWLIRCENTDNLRRPPNGGDWYREFFKAQFDGVAFEHLPAQSFAFITFNYDRSLEAAIHRFVRAKYKDDKRSDADIDGMCTSMLLRRIVHVHGSLGAMDWDIRKNEPSRPYSTTVTPETVQHAISQIKIMHEIGESEEFRIAHELLSAAERVYYVGFGYHPQNIARLYRDHGWSQNVSMSGTAWQFSERDESKALSSFPTGSPYMSLWPKDFDIITFLDSLQDL